MIQYKDFTPETLEEGFFFFSIKIESFDAILEKANKWSKDKNVINIESLEYRINQIYVTKAIRVWVKC